MCGKKHSVVVVDRHPIILQGVTALLSNEDGLEILAASTTSEEIFGLPENIIVDLVIVDLPQVEPDPFDFVERIIARYPGIRILVYTHLEDDRFFTCMADMGVAGCLLKTSPSSNLIEAVRCVLKRENYYAPSSCDILPTKIETTLLRVESVVDDLSSREKEVFRLLGDGFDSAVISSRLNISCNTADVHRSNIRRKLGLSSSKELYRLAYYYSVQGDSGIFESWSANYGSGK